MLFITIADLKKYLKAMILCDIIMIPKKDSWLRLVNCIKDEKNCVKVIFDNGSRDTMHIFLMEHEALIKGFDHEDGLNQYANDEWDNDFIFYTYQNMPQEYFSLLGKEDEKNEVTFCMWNRGTTVKWVQNEVEKSDGGRDYLLSYITKSADEWIEWAKDYYEFKPSKKTSEIVEAIYHNVPITEKMIVGLNKKRNPQEALAEIESIHSIYPFTS